MIFSIFTKLCGYHQYLILDHFHPFSPNKTYTIITHSSPSVPAVHPSSWQVLSQFLSQWICLFCTFHGLPKWHSDKEFACQCRRHKRCRFDSCMRRFPWNRKGQSTPVFLLERILLENSMGRGPWQAKSTRLQRVRYNQATEHITSTFHIMELQYVDFCFWLVSLSIFF